jgi:hypothetical protein
MSFTVNINNFRVNNMINNDSNVIGPGFHKSHSSSTKLAGNNSTSGDDAPALADMKILNNDSDIADQSEVGTSDPATVNQGDLWEY